MKASDGQEKVAAIYQLGISEKDPTDPGFATYFVSIAQVPKTP
jgi:hypothetical protein